MEDTYSLMILKEKNTDNYKLQKEIEHKYVQLLIKNQRLICLTSEPELSSIDKKEGTRS